jgi:excinuclease ABC subunit C
METIQETLKGLPHEPGVYQFSNANGEIIYVGKAVDLAKRVRQYFQRDDALGAKTPQLVSEIVQIKVIPTTSEFDALLLEAKLVRSLLPKFNSALRDDKSYLYVGFTLAEELPRILWLRKGEVSVITKNKKNKVYGPFQSPLALRSLMRYLRSVVPYCTQKQRSGKPCFYTHIGLCDPCPSSIVSMVGDVRTQSAKNYRGNIHKLQSIFEGHATTVIKSYEKEMRALAQAQKFEQAQIIKHRIDTMYRVSQQRYDPAIFLDRGAGDVYAEELNALQGALVPYYPQLTRLSRIECYDISQLSGTSAVGSMVVLSDGRPDNKEYRKFRIKTVKGISDVAMMAEMLTRRFSHPEWPPADFILVDGGKGQVHTAKTIMEAHNIHIPMAGLAKRNEEIILPNGKEYIVLRLPLSGKAIKVAQRIRDEAHRFAITYNRLLRSKRLLAV